MEQSESTAVKLVPRSRMATIRRWFQFSLLGFIVVLTVGCAWLGWQVECARRQREAVEAIEDLGGMVVYDWEQPTLDVTHHSILVCGPTEPNGPIMLRRLIGDDYFQRAVAVILDQERIFELSLDSSYIRRFIPECRRLRTLRRVDVRGGEADRIAIELRADLPNCEVHGFSERRWGEAYRY